MSCSAAARSRSPGRAPAILDGSGEVELATYKHFNTEDLLGEMALERMVAGLSTRNYSAGLEPVGDCRGDSNR